MGRPLTSFPCEINGDLLLFLLFDFEFFILKHFMEICSLLSIVTELALVVVEMLGGENWHCLIPLHMETDTRVPFY